MDKKVLLIGKLFYPNTSPGSHRMAKMAKYLSKYGWTPTVLCAEATPENSRQRYDPVLATKPDPSETIRVPLSGPPKMKFVRIIQYPFLRFTNSFFRYYIPFAFSRRMLKAAEDLVSKTQFDVIWSTAWPGLSHYVASKISKKYGIPWVADFRDLPCQTINNWIERRMVRTEIKICSSANALVTVSSVHVKMLRSRYKAPVHLVYNGYDPEDYRAVQSVDSEKFILGFFGILYFYRDPRPLFRALDLLCENSDVDIDKISVRFYGPPKWQIHKLVKDFRCRNIVQCCPRVGHDEMVQLQQQCAILLMLKSPTSQGALTSKIFGYLASQRMILNIPGDKNGVDDLLSETQAGISLAEPADIASTIDNWYQEWKKTGTVQCNSNLEAIMRYSREQQAGQLAGVFDSICS